ncbi:MAG: hypothetical protein ABJA78_17545 [Ferruginibacter sp.]
MKKYPFIILIFFCKGLMAQELFVFTEPASNMAKGSIAVRATGKLMKWETVNGFSYRTGTELMVGVSRKIMLHVNLYASDVYSPWLRFEGGSVYMKYRFFSNDDVHSHFRMAAFAKAAVISSSGLFQRAFLNEIDFDGNNSGWQTGIVATKLMNKIALSTSASYLQAVNNVNAGNFPEGRAKHAFNYTFSAGYLLFPKEYTNYRQTNINIMAEYLGQQLLDGSGSYNSICPSVQFIFNSIARVDMGVQLPVLSTGNKIFTAVYLLRVEYNFLNAIKSKNK